MRSGDVSVGRYEGGLHFDLEGAFSEVIVFPRFVGDNEVRRSGYTALVSRAHMLSELFKFIGSNGEIERQIMDHLALHEIDVAQLVKTLPNDSPTLVGICVIANNFTGEHVTSEEKPVAESAAGGGISCF